MLKKSIGTLGLILIFLLAPIEKTYASTDKDTIGTILEVEGTAQISADGTIREAKVNTPVHTGDIITTKAASRLYILLIDNTELTLAENGQLSVDNYLFDEKDNTENHAVYSVLKGAFLYASGMVAKKENPDVTVNIPNGSIGIRGTRFWGGEQNGNYNIIVGDGEIDIKTKAGKVHLKKGQGTTLKKTAAGIIPEAAKEWPKEKLAKAIQTVTLKNPTAIGQRMKVEQSTNQPKLRAQHIKNHVKKNEKLKPIKQNNPENMDSIRAQPMGSHNDLVIAKPTFETPIKPENNIVQKPDIPNVQEPEHLKAFEALKIQEEKKEEVKKETTKKPEPAGLQRQRLMERLKERGLQ